MRLFALAWFAMNRLLSLVSVALACLFVLAGCGDPQPVRIGFIGGITGRVADLGIGGRNGAMLAVEEFNQRGGLKGRPVELLIRDDQQNDTVARQALQDLIGQQVAAVIGPMTSGMCGAVLDAANAAQMLLVSPTCTSTTFSGKDDHFFRTIADTTAYARKSADFHLSQGHRRFAVIYDLGNRSYTESWLNDFRDHLVGKGGEIALTLTFVSGPDVSFADLAQQLAAAPVDAILIVANSVDAAMVAQQLDHFGNRHTLVASEWASTERLIELGGKAVEGMLLSQFLDRDSRLPEYQSFKAAFLKRFNQEPGFAGVAGYDAAKVVLDALSDKPANQPLKQRILALRSFQGASGTLEFTAQGDAERPTYITRIRDGRFHTER